MKLHFIDEPELEFGGAGRHIDIRHGLTEHGPLDRGLASAPQSVRVGVVGAAQDVERLREWIDRCRISVEAMPEPAPATPSDVPLLDRQQVFGYTQEDLKVILAPMNLPSVKATAAGPSQGSMRAAWYS